MSDKLTPPSDSSGTYSKSGNSSKLAGDPAQAQHGNRFAEVTRKSREARAKLDSNRDARAVQEEQRVVDARAEAAERDRQIDRAATPTAPPKSARDHAAAQLDAVGLPDDVDPEEGA